LDGIFLHVCGHKKSTLTSLDLDLPWINKRHKKQNKHPNNFLSSFRVSSKIQVYRKAVITLWERSELIAMQIMFRILHATGG
jgi:hypothetical protein